MRIFRYLVSGSIGLSVNLGVFRALYVFGVPSIIGSVIAFVIAMTVGFALQKYWTFEDVSSRSAHAQFAGYVAVALGNLAINTGIVYVLISKMGVHYLVAQTIGAAFVAASSFFIYRAFIFKTDAH